jgi:hypothetical protein
VLVLGCVEVAAIPSHPPGIPAHDGVHHSAVLHMPVLAVIFLEHPREKCLSFNRSSTASVAAVPCVYDSKGGGDLP